MTCVCLLSDNCEVTGLQSVEIVYCHSVMTVLLLYTWDVHQTDVWHVSFPPLPRLSINECQCQERPVTVAVVSDELQHTVLILLLYIHIVAHLFLDDSFHFNDYSVSFVKCIKYCFKLIQTTNTLLQKL